MCFQGRYRTEDKAEHKDSDRQLDIYELMSFGLKVGISMKDYDDMDFPLLVNLLDASLPKQKDKPKYREATQEDIDFFT